MMKNFSSITTQGFNANKINPLWYLAIGIVSMALTHMTFRIEVMTWVSSVPFLLYLSLIKGWKLRLTIFFALVLAWFIVETRIISNSIQLVLIILYSIPISLFMLYGATGQHNKLFDWVKKAIKKASPLPLLRYSDPAVTNDPGSEQYHQLLFTEDVFTTKTKDKPKKALLDTEAADHYKEKLLKHIKTDKPHLNPGLTLRSLADQLGINANQLSWLLNDGFGKNFNEFINYYRVKAFKKLAVQPDNSNLTLLAIAYDSGFNSKTVFNTYFKKETGKTPKEFLKG